MKQLRCVQLTVTWIALATASTTTSAQEGPQVMAIGATVGGPSTFVIAPMNAIDRERAISSSALIQDALIPALLTGARPVQLELVTGSNVVKRVPAYALGTGSGGRFYGNYNVSRIATQRKPDGTDEHLEVFLVENGQPPEKTYNVYDPLLQQLLIAAFKSKDHAGEPLRVDVQFQDDEIVTVHLGEKFEMIEAMRQQQAVMDADEPRVEIVRVRPFPKNGMTEFLYVVNHTSETIKFNKDEWYIRNGANQTFVKDFELQGGQPALIHNEKDFMSDKGDVISLIHREEVVDQCSYPELPQGVVVSCQEHLTGRALSKPVICINFKLFPDDTTLPSSFELGGYHFAKLGGASPLFVNESGTGKGLQFPKEGMEVILPAAVPSVRFEIGTFAGAVDVTAYDSKGTVAAQQTISGTNTFQWVTMSAADTASLVFTKGGNEAILSEICVELCSQH